MIQCLMRWQPAIERRATMSDYKLVPVEPTLDMMREGMEVYASED